MGFGAAATTLEEDANAKSQLASTSCRGDSNACTVAENHGDEHSLLQSSLLRRGAHDMLGAPAPAKKAKKAPAPPAPASNKTKGWKPKPWWKPSPWTTTKGWYPTYEEGAPAPAPAKKAKKAPAPPAPASNKTKGWWKRSPWTTTKGWDPTYEEGAP